jgi:hypothetical protein
MVDNPSRLAYLTGGGNGNETRNFSAASKSGNAFAGPHPFQSPGRGVFKIMTTEDHLKLAREEIRRLRAMLDSARIRLEVATDECNALRHRLLIRSGDEIKLRIDRAILNLPVVEGGKYGH